MIVDTIKDYGQGDQIDLSALLSAAYNHGSGHDSWRGETVTRLFPYDPQQKSRPNMASFYQSMLRQKPPPIAWTQGWGGPGTGTYAGPDAA